MLRASYHIPTCTAPNVRVRTSGNRIATPSDSAPRSRRRSLFLRPTRRARVIIRVVVRLHGVSRSGPDRDGGRTSTPGMQDMTVTLVSADLVLVADDCVDDDHSEGDRR